MRGRPCTVLKILPIALKTNKAQHKSNTIGMQHKRKTNKAQHKKNINKIRHNRKTNKAKHTFSVIWSQLPMTVSWLNAVTNVTKCYHMLPMLPTSALIAHTAYPTNPITLPIADCPAITPPLLFSLHSTSKTKEDLHKKIITVHFVQLSLLIYTG